MKRTVFAIMGIGLALAVTPALAEPVSGHDPGNIELIDYAPEVGIPASASDVDRAERMHASPCGITLAFIPVSASDVELTELIDYAAPASDYGAASAPADQSESNIVDFPGLEVDAIGIGIKPVVG